MAWRDLITLANDHYGYVRQEAVEALGYGIPFAPNKNQVWEDLSLLLMDEDWIIRGRTVDAIGKAFMYMPNSDLAWNKLITSAYDQDKYVRWKTAQAIGNAFRDLPHKTQAWDVIIEFISDQDDTVQEVAAHSLNLTFRYLNQIQDIDKTLHDLQELVNHKNNYVRMYAYYCLGRASINAAIESENEVDFRNRLKEALKFFGKAHNQQIYNNPARFCLPFYSSFYALAFEDSEAKKHIDKYLLDAQRASEGSKNKEILLKAVENLSQALLEVESLRIKNLDVTKRDLKIFKRYCEHASDLLASSEKGAPNATKLILKGVPIIDRRIRTILGEIKEKARNFCESARNTPFREIGKGTLDFTKRLDHIDNKESARDILIDLVIYVQPMCIFLPESSKTLICGQLNNIENSDIQTISVALKNTLTALNVFVSGQQEQISYLKNIVEAKLNGINYDVFRIKISSGDLASNLRTIKREVDELHSIKNSLNALGSSFQDVELSMNQQILINHHDVDQIADQLETLIIERPETAQTKKILDLLEQMKKSNQGVLFDRIAGLSSMIGLILSILQFPVPKS